MKPRGESGAGELVKVVSIDTFTSPRCDLCVEGRSNDLEDAAANSARLLARKGRVASLTVVCGLSAAEASARDAFSRAFPGVDVAVQAPPGPGAMPPMPAP